MGKVRPGVILSNSDDNSRLPTVMVVPFSRQPPEAWPFRLRLYTDRFTDNFAVIPGLRQVNKARLGDMLGELAAEDMKRLTDAVMVYMQD